MNRLCSLVVPPHAIACPNISFLACPLPFLESYPMNISITISLNELNSQAHAPGFSVLPLARNNIFAIHWSSEALTSGRFCLDVLQNKLTLKLHSSAGEIVKKTDGGPKKVQRLKTLFLPLQLLHKKKGHSNMKPLQYGAQMLIMYMLLFLKVGKKGIFTLFFCKIHSKI